MSGESIPGEVGESTTSFSVVYEDGGMMTGVKLEYRAPGGDMFCVDCVVGRGTVVV